MSQKDGVETEVRRRLSQAARGPGRAGTPQGLWRPVPSGRRVGGGDGR